MKRPVEEKIAVGKTKMIRFRKHNVPKKRKFGQSLTVCQRCGGTRRHISKYGLHLCGRCFREVAKLLGFKKLR